MHMSMLELEVVYEAFRSALLVSLSPSAHGMCANGRIGRAYTARPDRLGGWDSVHAGPKLCLLRPIRRGQGWRTAWRLDGHKIWDDKRGMERDVKRKR